MDRWSGRVAVVTGASSGIGAAIVRDLVTSGLVVVGLARRDYRIMLATVATCNSSYMDATLLIPHWHSDWYTSLNHDVQEDVTIRNLQETDWKHGKQITDGRDEMSDELRECKGKLYALKTDITKENDILAAFRWIDRNLGGVDVLVNNAGMAIRTDVLDGKMDEWRKMFDLNVFALGACSREAIKSMRARGVDDGHIININSVASHRVSPFLGNFVYNASKHASLVLTEGMRRELVSANSRIKVTSVSPGLVDTEIFEVGGWKEDILANNPYLQAKDIADAVHYVLSTPSSVQVNEVIVRPVGEGV